MKIQAGCNPATASSHVHFDVNFLHHPLFASVKLFLSPKAISIVGDEVFSFTMSLTPNATEGAAYTDTSKSDGRVKLNVGCIQVVYLHRFIMSLLVSFLHSAVVPRVKDTNWLREQVLVGLAVHAHMSPTQSPTGGLT